MEIMGLTGNVDANFWKNKKVFLTGHTGFKGSWCSLWLQSMGSVVKGYALEPYTNPNLFSVAKVSENMQSEIGDIRELDKLTQSMTAFNPDVLIHMAAQPLVRYSYQNPIETYQVNVIGTANVLEAARKCPNLKAIVSVTTDKCYENKEWEWGYRENEPMGGNDPYSSSKGCAELVTAAYRKSYFFDNNTPSLASARAGNVIGGGDWSDDRLIPDFIRAIEQNKPILVRNPLAIRPWQHVLEPLSGYLLLAEVLYKKGNAFAEGWNFGPYDQDCKPVQWILDNMVELWGKGASWALDNEAHPHEARFLKLDISKAKTHLQWQPKWNLEKTLRLIVDWHKNYFDGADMQALCLKEIKNYSE